jgi:sulfur carrier protein ThiS
MQIKVVLLSTFRNLLPPETRGRTTLDMPDGSTIKDVLAKMEINIHALVSLNGQIERDFEHLLKDGDEVKLFRPVGGG